MAATAKTPQGGRAASAGGKGPFWRRYPEDDRPYLHRPHHQVLATFVTWKDREALAMAHKPTSSAQKDVLAEETLTAFAFGVRYPVSFSVSTVYRDTRDPDGRCRT